MCVDVQARSCPYAKNQLLAHHFGKKNQLLALKNITTDMGRIPLFSIITDNDYNVFYMQSGRSGQRE